MSQAKISIQVDIRTIKQTGGWGTSVLLLTQITSYSFHSISKEIHYMEDRKRRNRKLISYKATKISKLVILYWTFHTANTVINHAANTNFCIFNTLLKKFTRFIDFFLPNLPGTGTGGIPDQWEFGKWHPGWGREYRKTLFTV